MTKRLKESDLVRIIDDNISKSSTYTTKISKDRATAIKYYNKEAFGNERKGRSAYVSSEVQEVISWLMPQLMKVFCESDVVKFDPIGPGKEFDAQLATEYAKYVLYKKNKGFLILHDLFHDALLQKNGVVKISFDKTQEYKREEYEGLTDLELTQLLQNPDLEPIEHETKEGPVDPHTGQPTFLHDVTVKIKLPSNGKIKLENVPPEEIIVSNKTRSLNLDESPFVAQQVKKTISWCRSQGWKVADDIQDGQESDVEYSQERIARHSVDGNYGDTYSSDNISPIDPAEREVWVVESYFKCDYNNDGISELRQVIKVGSKVLSNEEVFTQPFVSTSPFPQPHKYNGLSMADIVKDLQLLKSMLMRSMLDSFAFNINPSKAIDVTKLVDINDLLDTNPGNYIRMRGDTNNAFYTMPSSGVGQEAFSLLGYIDDIAESRSGVNRMTQGIDANIFNKTATGTAAIMSASQEKIAMIIRIFAEVGIGEIYKKIIQLASNYAEGPELIQIDSLFAQVDPKQWTNLDSVTVCVGTGSLDKQVELQNLNQIIQLQNTFAQAPMPEAKALVGPDKVYNALSSLVKSMGYKDSAAYFNSPQSPEYGQVLQHIQQMSQPQPDPNLIMAQSAQKQVQQDMLIKTAEFELKKLEADRDFELTKFETRLKYEVEIAKLDQKDSHLIVNTIAGELGNLTQLEPGSGLLPQSEIAALQSVSQIAQENAPQQPQQPEQPPEPVQPPEPPAPPPPDPAEIRHQQMMASMNKPPMGHKIIRDENGKMIGIEPVLQ